MRPGESLTHPLSLGKPSVCVCERLTEGFLGFWMPSPTKMQIALLIVAKPRTSDLCNELQALAQIVHINTYAIKHKRAHTATHTECCFETLAPVYIPSGPAGSSSSNETLAGHMLVLKCPLLGTPAWPSSTTHTRTNTCVHHGISAYLQALTTDVCRSAGER